MILSVGRKIDNRTKFFKKTLDIPITGGYSSPHERRSRCFAAASLFPKFTQSRDFLGAVFRSLLVSKTLSTLMWRSAAAVAIATGADSTMRGLTVKAVGSLLGRVAARATSLLGLYFGISRNPGAKLQAHRKNPCESQFSYPASLLGGVMPA
jgi:hypothetical protein